LHLQTAYGQAMMMTKGYAAEETKAAFARAAELAGRTRDFSEQFTLLRGQFAAATTAGELRSAHELALTLLRQAGEAGRDEETGVANWWLGMIAYWRGDFADARTYYDRALDARDLNPDPKLQERVGDFNTWRTWASAQFAVVAWALGDLERARKLIDMATRRAAESGAPTIANALFWKSYLELWRGDPAATLSAAGALELVAQEHGIAQYLNEAELHSGWARGRIDDPAAGAAQVQRVLAAFVGQGVRVNLEFYTGLLAQLEAETLGADGALARIDEAFRLSEQVEHRCSLPFLHRLRGEILLKRNPADPAPAEEAFRTSIAIAKEQGARSPVLLASIALAKLYQSTARPADAHAVLAPALEGFLPTPEMPEIAEAQAMLAALTETEEVKAAAASRQRRLKLQTSLSQAMMWSRGFASDESKTAFARAQILAVGVGDAGERFDAYFGMFAASLLRGEISLARETAESFLRDAENGGWMAEAGVARRCLGMVCFFQGDFIGAEANLAEALRTYALERDHDAKFRFGGDEGAIAAGYLALANWALGDVERARTLSNEALARADETAHAPTRATVYHHVSLYHMLRGDPEAVRRVATVLVDLGREHGMALYLAYGEVFSTWARARLGDRESGVTGLREALGAYLRQGNKLFVPLYQGRLAELEAEGDAADGALRQIDEALALANGTGGRWIEALLHRIRGAILLKRDPANPAPAGEAFLAAIAIAQAQKARSLELQAALALAKLYQSTARPVEGHTVLAPALEGFSPTPAMPEIAEAQALLERLGQGGEGAFASKDQATEG
jgi:predicted ATPase